MMSFNAVQGKVKAAEFLVPLLHKMFYRDAYGSQQHMVNNKHFLPHMDKLHINHTKMFK